MNKQIFVSLAVKDVEKSKAFYSALGYAINPQFTNEHAAGMIINEGSIYVMLATEAFLKTLTTKQIVNAREATGALISLSCESREEVDGLVAKAIAAGGKALGEPQDHGFMYDHSFEDPDGNGWGVFYMKP